MTWKQSKSAEEKKVKVSKTVVAVDEASPDGDKAVQVTATVVDGVTTITDVTELKTETVFAHETDDADLADLLPRKRQRINNVG